MKRQIILSMVFVIFIAIVMPVLALEPGDPSVPISDNLVTPIYIAGNPDCAMYGLNEVKFDPPVSSTILPVTIVVDADVYFDWTSTFGIDKVIVKGGPNANAYIYDPPAESFGDGGLAAPLNPNNNKLYDLSHISFCYDGVYPPPPPVPEFPTLALPVGMLIGLVGLVFVVKSREK